MIAQQVCKGSLSTYNCSQFDFGWSGGSSDKTPARGDIARPREAGHLAKTSPRPGGKFQNNSVRYQNRSWHARKVTTAEVMAAAPICRTPTLNELLGTALWVRLPRPGLVYNNTNPARGRVPPPRVVQVCSGAPPRASDLSNLSTLPKFGRNNIVIRISALRYAVVFEHFTGSSGSWGTGGEPIPVTTASGPFGGRKVQTCAVVGIGVGVGRQGLWLFE